MLFWIAEQLGFPGVLNLFRYQTTRIGGAIATALMIGLIIVLGFPAALGAAASRLIV